MARASGLQVNLGAELLPALKLWAAAVTGLRENALYQLLRRASIRRREPGIGAALFNFLPLAIVFAAFFGAGYFYLHRFMYVPQEMRLPLALLLGLMAAFGLWVALAVYETAIYAQRLLSVQGSLGRHELSLDEGMLSARLDDRELVCGLVAACLPRLWLRWAFAAPAVLLCYIVLLSLLSQSDSAARVLLLDAPSDINPAAAIAFSLLTLAVLLLVGLLASILLLLFLIALGRSIGQHWQAVCVAASIACVQLAFVPLGFETIFKWREYTGASFGADLELIGNGIAPFLPLAYFSAVMHFARRRPTLRIFLAAFAPPAGLAMWWLVLHAVKSDGGRRMVSLLDTAYTLGWYFSSAALLNPLAIPFAPSLGISQRFAFSFQSLDWFRLPLLLLMLLALIGICATAARHAVHDWRHAEE